MGACKVLTLTVNVECARPTGLERNVVAVQERLLINHQTEIGWRKTFWDCSKSFTASCNAGCNYSRRD